MPRIFSLANPRFDIPPVGALEAEWLGAAAWSLAREIGFQDQFRQLFVYLLENLQSVPVENPDWRPRALSLSVRAGAVKTYVLLTVSIAESALAALGEERNLGRRPGELYERSFGGLLEAWKDGDEPRAELRDIWGDLELLKTYRNLVHLHRAARDGASWQEIRDNEERIFAASNRVIEHLRQMCHLFRDL